jgi:hypothetical protein
MKESAEDSEDAWKNDLTFSHLPPLKCHLRHEHASPQSLACESWVTKTSLLSGPQSFLQTLTPVQDTPLKSQGAPAALHTVLSLEVTFLSLRESWSATLPLGGSRHQEQVRKGWAHNLPHSTNERNAGGRAQAQSPEWKAEDADHTPLVFH